MSSSSAGRHELDAIKQRISAANAQVSSTAKSLHSAKAAEKAAKKMLKMTQQSKVDIESQLERAKRELDAAKKRLLDTEKRLEVIKIDIVEEPEGVEDKSRKRRKVSSSQVRIPSFFVADQIVLDGCGMLEVNGVYKRVRGLEEEGSPVYSKRVLWKGEEVDFVICKESRQWHIGSWKGLITSPEGFFSRWFYASVLNTDRKDPPKKGWEASGAGVDPPPSINIDNSYYGVNNISTTVAGPPPVKRIVVEGSGNTELNGIYRRFPVPGYDVVFTKQGQWKGKAVMFAIFRKEYIWYVARTKTSPLAVGSFLDTKTTMFKSHMDSSNVIPPSDWGVVGRTRGGVDPTPKCSYHP